MTYSPGGPGYSGPQQSGAYAPTPHISKVDDSPSRLPVYLLAGVAILGLAAYLLTFGPVLESGAAGSGSAILGIIAMMFAALFAVIAMLPKQGKHTAVITATAVVGFLLVVWELIQYGSDAGWALIGIVVVSAVQTIVAIAALLLDAGVISPPAPRPNYDAYQQDAYQQYGGRHYGPPQFGQPQPGGPQRPPAQGPPSFSQPQGYPQHGGYPGGSSPGGFPAQEGPAGPPTPPTGFPAHAQPQREGQGAEQQPAAPPQEAPTQQVRMPTPQAPVPHSPTQSPTQQIPVRQSPTEQVPAEQQPSGPPPS